MYCTWLCHPDAPCFLSAPKSLTQVCCHTKARPSAQLTPVSSLSQAATSPHEMPRFPYFLTAGVGPCATAANMLGSRREGEGEVKGKVTDSSARLPHDKSGAALNADAAIHGTQQSTDGGLSPRHAFLPSTLMLTLSVHIQLLVF